MINNLKERLVAFGQEHVLAHWDSLSSEGQRELAAQLESVDLALVQRLYQQAQSDSAVLADLDSRAQSPPAVTSADLADPARRQAAIEAGEAALRAGRVGMILVAGGQGSRLGFEHPKGMFPIGPLSGRTLFQMLTDLLQARGRHYNTRIPLYVMTSPATDAATREHFEQQNYFGLPAGDLQVFCQGTMPAVDAASGRLLLSAPDQLFLSPDGHGGMLPAFLSSGCLADAAARGIEHLFYCQVDNPLVQICDPLLIGLHVLQQAEVTTQVVRKSEPLQRVGNVVRVDDHLEVIEYSDLPETLARQTLPDGSLRFWAGNIAVHVFERSFLERAVAETVQQGQGLPFHIAKKKVPFVDEAGATVQPASENAYKFERFIFDLLPLAKSAMVVEVAAEEGFAAVKNAETAKSETATTTKAAIVAQHTRWLRAAGVTVADGVQVEIHPSVAHDSATVAQRFAGHPPIESDRYFEA